MGTHPVNLALRFLLEIIALIAVGLWSYRLTNTSWKYVLVLFIPLLIALVWGLFNVPGDPSRSGAAPVVIPGMVRLIIELVIFSFASWALFQTGHNRWSIIFLAVVIGHYLFSLDRITWLTQH